MRNVSKDFVLSHLLCNPRLKRWRHPSFAEFLGSFLFCRPSKNAPTCSNSSFLSSLKCWCPVAISLATRVRRTHSSFIDVRERSRIKGLALSMLSRTRARGLLWYDFSKIHGKYNSVATIKAVPKSDPHSSD